MRVDDRDRIYVNTKARYWGVRFKSGLKNILHSIPHMAVFAAFTFMLIYLTKDQLGGFLSIVSDGEYSLLLYTLWYGLPLALYPLALAVAVICLGTPKEYLRFRNELLRIGLVNSAGKCPVLIAKHKDSKYPQSTVYEFLTLGIPMKEWEDKRAKIEAALNVHMVKVTEGKNKKTMLLYAVSADNKLPSYIKWDDKYMVNDTSTLVLGRNHLGDITVNLAKIPHVLLGGSTGSGKSVLLKLLLMQAIKKNIVVTIADFKGGVDFPPIWHKKCNICTDEDINIVQTNLWQKARKKINPDLMLSNPTPTDESQVFTDDERRLMRQMVFEDLETYSDRPTSAGLQILFMLETGLRMGECCGLKWSDVRNGRLYIQRQARNDGVREWTKTTNGYRDIPLTDEAQRILEAVKRFNKEHGFKAEWVFQSDNAKYDYRLSYNAANNKLRKLCIRMDSVIKSPHKLRKTCLSALIDNPNVSNRTVQRFASHSDITTTLTYYSFDRSSKEEQAIAINEALKLD